MQRSSELPGQAPILRQVRNLVKAGRSVLLFGPEAIGKSAIIAAVADTRLVIVDPFEHVSPQRACHIRRALDRGVVHLAAARMPGGRGLGSVGRILWRFSTVRIRELPESIIRRIVIGQIRAVDIPSIDRHWIHEIAVLARGRPGFATMMARLSVEWKRQHGYLPIPAFAFAAMREDVIIHMLQRREDVHRHTREGRAKR